MVCTAFFIRYFRHKWSVCGENREEKIDKWKKMDKMEVMDKPDRTHAYMMMGSGKERLQPYEGHCC